MDGRDIKIGTGRFAKRETMCWYCSRATDSSCPWSESFTPVDGWTAKYDPKHKSYFVTDCPLFQQYENNTLTDKGAKNLGNAVIATFGKDLLWACRSAIRSHRKLPWAKTVITLYGKQPNTLYGKPMRTVRSYGQALSEIKSLERFFKSEHALLFSNDLNPVYIMELIKRETGYDRL